MFKVIHKLDRQEIVILDPAWRRNISVLQAMDEQNLLICPLCEQPVRTRLGNVRRWHFAHKHLQNCPYQSVSPHLLHCRALLYEWLVELFPPGAVKLEVNQVSHNLPRAIDCWVDYQDSQFAYWIIESRLTPAIRDQISTNLSFFNIPINYIFTSEMLHQDQLQTNNLYLTTTERQFMQKTMLDDLYPNQDFIEGKSLHYLNPEREQITTFRGLYLIHPPQLHKGIQKISPLDNIKASQNTGEFIHPGEDAVLEKYITTQQNRNRTWTAKADKFSPTIKKITGVYKQGMSPPSVNFGSNLNDKISTVQNANPSQLQIATCIFCGQQTDDWWWIDGRTGNAKCRECYRKGLY